MVPAAVNVEPILLKGKPAAKRRRARQSEAAPVDGGTYNFEGISISTDSIPGRRDGLSEAGSRILIRNPRHDLNDPAKGMAFSVTRGYRPLGKSNSVSFIIEGAHAHDA